VSRQEFKGYGIDYAEARPCEALCNRGRLVETADRLIGIASRTAKTRGGRRGAHYGRAGLRVVGGGRQRHGSPRFWFGSRADVPGAR